MSAPERGAERERAASDERDGDASAADAGDEAGEGGLGTLLVGIDAGCLPLLEPFFEEGRLPNLRALFESGANGPLQSHVPPWTPSAWPTLYTGTNPAKHGVFSFLTYDGYDYSVVTGDEVREPSLWEVLDANDLSSVVVNVPVTHPPRAFDGALIPGFVGPEDPRCHPPGLLDEVREAIGEYRVYGEHEFDADAPESVRTAEYESLVASRGAAFRYLVDRFRPDFGFVQFQQTDTVCHDYPGDIDKLARVYEAVDRQVGQILDACDPDTVVVASDHGIGPYEGYEFRVNEFLRRRGYVQTTRDTDGMPSWVPEWESNLRDGERAAADADGGKTVADTRNGPAIDVGDVATALAKVGVTTDRVVRVLDALGLTDVARKIVPSSVAREAHAGERVDFTRSMAYMRLPVELGVRINLEGREPSGIVPPQEYERVRAELIDVLAAVETPDGGPVFELVAPREQFFHGPALEGAPDIVTIPANFDQFPSATLRDEVFGRPNEPWNHKFQGVVAVAGDAVDVDAGVAGASLLDVAPTVLASLGVPMGDRMDGRVLPVLPTAGTRSYDAPERGDETFRDAGVESRLADLGYLE